MRNINSLSVKTQALLKILCLAVCIVLSVSSFAACKPSNDVAESSSQTSSDSNNEQVDDQQNNEEPPVSSEENLTPDEPTYEDLGDTDAYYQEPVQLSVYNSRAPINDNYLGMNATVYHAFNYILRDTSDSRGDYTDEMIEIELDRLQNMGFTNIRTMFQARWIWDGTEGTFDFNSKRMNHFIDYCLDLQERDMKVMLNNMWYFTACSNGNAGNVNSPDYYLDGNGEDKYAETLNYTNCIATEHMIKSDVSPKDYGLQNTPYAGDQTMTDYYYRIGVSAIRYAEITSKIIQAAKARGVNNIDYIFHFTEPSYYYQTPNDPTGPVNEEYLFFCRTFRNVFDKKNIDIKHVGPNQGHIIRGDGLLKYCAERDPELFDVWTSHFYPQAIDSTNDVFYDYSYEALSSYIDTMKATGLWGKVEFWQDEMFAKLNNGGLYDKEIGSLTTQTIVSAICSQQMGVDNVLMWQAFDQAFPESLENSGEFKNGIHISGTCPSLYVSTTPYVAYYGMGLFARYNNSKNGGKAYATSSGDYEDYPGVYVGATQLDDGNWTFTVVSVNVTKTPFVINFDKALGKNLHRHVEDIEKRDPKTSARLADADATFVNVKDKLADTIEPFAIHIYTTCEY